MSGVEPAEQRRVLYVFLASPSDLATEREIVREAITSLNRAVGRRLSLQIELLGWEDTMPGVARPQSLINEEVDRCNLFIGMLSRRWGTPTGEYSSGFEEEFRRAEARTSSDGSPNMWLFFKRLSNADVEDAGPQLERVLTFRDEIIASKTHLFKEFVDEQDLSSMLTEYLLQLLIEPPSISDTSASQVDLRLPPRTATEVLPDALLGSDAGAKDLIVSLESALEATKDKKTASKVTAEVAARLSTFAHAAFFTSTGRLISAPAVALELYRYRKKVVLTPAELELLFYEVLPDEPRTPGWYWFRDSTSPQLAKSLADLAHNEQQPPYLRAAAVGRLLQLVPPGELSDTVIIEFVLDYEPPFTSIRTRSLKELFEPHLRSLNGALLDALAAQASLVGLTARRELTRREAEKDATAAIFAIVNDPSLAHPRVEFSLIAGTSRVEDAALQALARSDDPALRQIALTLIGAGRTDRNYGESLAEVLLADNDSNVRIAAARALHRLGVAIPDDIFDATFAPRGSEFNPRGSDPNSRRRLRSTLLAEQMRLKHGPASLVDMVTFANLAVGEAAYKALISGPDGADRARRDLRDRFAAAADQSAQRLRQVLGDDFRRRVAVVSDEDTVKKALTTVAIERLSVEHDSSDAPLVRTLIGDALLSIDGRRAAIRLLGAIGDQSDLEALASFAVRPNESASVALNAMRAIFSRLGYSDMASSASAEFLVAVSREHGWDDVLAYARSALTSRKYEIRQGAAAVLVARLERDELERLLESTLEGNNTMLDIVAVFDEYLYFTSRTWVSE